MANGSLSFIGTFTSGTTDPSGNRIFVLSTTVYNNERSRALDNKPEMLTSFNVVCALPKTERWQNFPTPAPRRQLQASGDWVRYSTYQNQQYLCMVVSSLSFLSRALSTAKAAIPSVSTIPGRRRRRALGEGMSEAPMPDKANPRTTISRNESPLLALPLARIHLHHTNPSGFYTSSPGESSVYNDYDPTSIDGSPPPESPKRRRSPSPVPEPERKKKKSRKSRKSTATADNDGHADR
ncbi:hypothetical protein PDIDSM_135 [Penicillium digitatum]|nr:hypothetical protein PDIDSM_135 [Penicillium digitatum]